MATASTTETETRNAREILEGAANWLAYQDESLSFGLKTPEDALKLYLYWQAHPNLPEFCDRPDDDGKSLSRKRKKVLGYDPLA